MKKFLPLIGLLCASIAIAQPPASSPKPVTIDPATGNIAPSTVNGHVPNLPAGTILGTAAIQTKSGVLALGGFSSITGRAANVNLPLGAQLYDNAGTPKLILDVNAQKVYASNGTDVVLDWSNGTSIFIWNNTASFEKTGGMHFYGADGIDTGDNNIIAGAGTVQGFEFQVGISPRLGTISAASLTTNRTFTLPDQSGTIAMASTTKVYRAILTQSGTSAPAATVLENSLGGTVVWTRTDVGTYSATLTAAFTANKTWAPSPSGPFNGLSGTLIRVNANAMRLVTFADDGGPVVSDDVLDSTPVEILVYP